MPRSSQDDFSLSMDSVFDWGSLPSGGKRRAPASAGMATLTSAEGRTTAGHVSRYDPTSMHRISDINDLVDDSTSDDDDDEPVIGGGSDSSMEGSGSDVEEGGIERQEPNGTHNFSLIRGAGSPLWHRQALVLAAIAAIVLAASLAIGFAVSSSDPYSIAVEGDGGGGSGSSMPEQTKLELAERIVSACDANQLNEDRSECQKLCHSSLCCFESGKYSCEEDVRKDCAVYAGCEALVEGIPVGSVEEDEE